MKLYVVRDKETGKLATSWELDVEPLDDNVFLSEEYPTDIPMLTIDQYEIVTLRVEPTEPCEWCETYGGEMLSPSDDLYAYECALDAEDWQFCPNCGRSLE